MNAIAQMPLTMSSREIADLVNSRHDKVKQSIERLVARGVIAHPPMGEVQEVGGNGRVYVTQEYRIGKRDSYVIVAQLSPEFTARLVDRWQELEAAQPVRLPTTAEAFANVFQMVADQERRQFEQDATIKQIGNEVEQIKAAQSVMTSRPANAEAMTHLRKRIGKMFGLSEKIIDDVMRQSPYAPKPAGMVRNDHSDADGATYAVYWRKDVTKTFERFVLECVPVTSFMFTHPFIEGRFRVASKAAAA